jgi:hypothetical protein
MGIGLSVGKTVKFQHELTRAEAAERYREYTAILAGYPECVELTKWREYLEQLKIKWKLEK